MGNLPDVDIIPVRSEKRQGGVSVSVVENLLLGLVDGKMSVGELGEACGVDASMAQRIVAKLYNAGYVQLYRKKSSQNTDNILKTNGNSSGAASAASAHNSDGGDDSIDTLYERFDKMNYYEILGVPPDAERATIRNAYFALSKKYHPDTCFGGNDAALKQKLGRIFDQITIAYETLSGKSKRQQYDASIADQIEMWKLENQLKMATGRNVAITSPSNETAGAQKTADNRGDSGRVAVRGISASRGATAVASARQSGAAAARPSEPSSTSYRRTPVQDSVRVGVGARVSRIPVTRTSYTEQVKPESSATASRSTAASSGSSAARASVPSSAPVGATSMSPEERELRRQKWKRERLKKALGNSVPPASVRRSIPGPSTNSENHLLEHARIAIEHNEFDHAVQYLQEVLRRDGENSAASMLLQRAQSGKVKHQINELIRQGRFEQGRGKANIALELYERALKLDTRNIEAMHHVAGALLETGKDLSRAFQLSRIVVDKGGSKASYFAVLSELLVYKGDMTRATDMMQKAVGLAPDNKEYKKRLKAMKK